MPKYGKIARQPRNIRDELNRRIDNGEMGVRLVEWLNSLPEVQQVLKTCFDGREISEQNLTEWKANGYLAWQNQQDALARARESKANATELAAESGGPLTESLVTLVAARYAAVLDRWNGELTDEMRHQLRELEGICRAVLRLRHSDQVLERMKIQREWLALGSKTSELNQLRYEDATRTQQGKALELCLDDSLEFPEIQKLFRQAFEELEKALAGDNSPSSDLARILVGCDAKTREDFLDWLKSDEARKAHEKRIQDRENGPDDSPKPEP